MFKLLILCLYLSILLHEYVDCQICEERKMFTYTMTQRHWRSEVEHYTTKCWYGTCTKTRLRYVPTEIVVTKQSWKPVKVCCEGYTEADSEEIQDMLICNPICMPSCINGYCQSPGVCACNAGYIPNPYNLFSCLPNCLEECEHGTCVAPNTCDCSFGYKSLLGKCQPICSGNCENGKCVAPETCECVEGYKSEDGVCKFYCEFCGTGSHCTGPGECTCDIGFQNINNSCSPICTTGCNGGSCIAPNTCECLAGYQLINGTCEPQCPNCNHGHCQNPFECICDAGYVLEIEENFEFTCQVNCTVDCGNGKCVSPDVCACDSGYVPKESCDPTCCEPFCSKGCNFGTCEEPEFCVCDPGYVIEFNTSECIPKCDYDCGHGKCVGPNTCDCDDGYGQNETEEFIDAPICKPICKNCEGTCVAPYECICDSNVFTTLNVTEDGGVCNCFVNCTKVTSVECERTLCREHDILHRNDSWLGHQPISPTMDISTVIIEEFSSTFEYTTEQYHSATEVKLSSSEVMSSTTEFIPIKAKIHQEGETANDESSSNAWIYYIVAAVVAVLLVVMALGVFLLRRLGYLRSDSYVIENKGAPEPSQNDFDLIVR